MEFKGCAAIVTGGSGGLGQRICRALAQNGVDVVVNSIAPGFMEGTRMSVNWSADYAAGAASRTLLRRTVSKDDVAEQLIAFCRSDSVTGQTILMDSGRV